MRDTTGEKLNELIAPIVPFFFAEAETDSRPYAVYTKTTEPVYTKDGLHHFASAVDIFIYAETFAQSEEIAEAVRSAIHSGMRNATYSARLVDDENQCLEGVWSFSLTYNIKQYK